MRQQAGKRSYKRHEYKELLREEAADRQVEYDIMTTKQKLARARSRRGSSAKEIARLEARAASED